MISAHLESDNLLQESEVFDSMVSELVEDIQHRIDAMRHFIEAVADNEEGPEPYNPDMN